MKYLEYNFEVKPVSPWTDVLIAALGGVGFESFEETETGVLAYVQHQLFDEKEFEAIDLFENNSIEISYTSKEIAQVNWNEEWEKNFDPIEVNATCTVRAPFHPKKDFEYDIIIEPKMSFGTGHHETTFMMLQFILENEWDDKTVLDMGCGTAVLAILAEMRGASNLDAIDIDEWCYENSIENVERNNCKHISVFQGDASLLTEKKYDVIIANINRNILLADMATYKKVLNDYGTLYLSGFYEEDLPIITQNCNNLGFTFVQNKLKNRWVAAKFCS